MRGVGVPGVALLAVAFIAVARAQIKNDDILEVFKTWDHSSAVKYVHHFDEHAERETPKKMESEHVRRKRNTDRVVIAESLPIAKTCEMPGYTGQFCEFPICQETNPFVNPRQFEIDDATYPIDVAPMGACNRIHTTIIDDSLSYVEIFIQADKDVNPKVVVTDAQGVVYQPDRLAYTSRSAEVIFNKLPPGVYITRPSADADNANCVLLINARTKVTLSSEFTRGDERDRYDFGTPNAIVHEFNALSLHANNNPSPASLKSVTIFAPGGVILRPQQLSTRFGCGYEFFVDSFFCSVTGAYTLVAEGVDFQGFVFRRAGTFKCLVDPSPPTRTPAISTPKPTPPTQCNNGGVLVQIPGQDAYCACADMWAGPTCNYALCANGGTPLADGQGCRCPNEFTGLHCEDVTCSEQAGHGFDVNRPTLVLVIRVRKSMAEAIKQVRLAVLDMLEALQFDPEYLSRFALIAFNNNQIIFSDEFRDVTALAKQLELFTNSTSTDGNCTDAVFSATATALTDLLITNKSPVYVITDALPGDYDSDLEALFQLDSYWRIPLNFFYIQPDASSSCAPDEDSPQFRALDDISARSSGSAVFIRDVTNVHDVLYFHLRYTSYRSQLLLTGDRQFCGSENNLYKTISVDRTVDTVAVIAKGKNLFIKLTDPNGDVAHPDLVFNHEDFYIWHLDNPILGNYDFLAATNPAQAFCSFRVFQSSHLSGSLLPPGDIFWGFSAMLDQDSNFVQPLAGVESAPVFHLNDYRVFRPDRAFTSLNIYTFRGDREIELYAANGIYRDGCSYKFYFPTFTCNREREVLHFNFFARDEIGYYIQRAGSMYCYRFHPTPEPPGDCQNGGILGPNNTCICMPFFTGAHCEQIECLNGGKPGRERCSCLPGFAGRFCEYATCLEPAPRPQFGLGVDFMIVVEMTKAGYATLQSLNKVLPDVLRDVHSQHADWIRRVVLVGFNSTYGGVLVDARAGEYDAVLKKISDLAAAPSTDTKCVVTTWTALREALLLREGVPRGSIINVFQSSIPDNVWSLIYAIQVAEELRQSQALLNVFQTYIPEGTGYYCNANETDFKLLSTAAKRSNGHFYTFHAKQVEQVVRLLPTFYSSGVIYQRYFDDCTKSQNVYFPIDAHTQTIQVIAQGTDSSIAVYKADGRPLSDTPIEIVDDQQTGWHIVEYRNPCDQEWQPLSQYCIRFDGLPKTRDSAAQVCAYQGADIIDDLSISKHQYLKTTLNGIQAWLGLRFIDNVWVFQYGNGKTGPVGTDTFWKDGKVPTDPNTPCAFLNSDGSWEATKCDVSKVVVCQKLAYDLDHTPGRIGDDDIAPGKYYATVTTKPTNGSGYCFVEVRAQSAVRVESAFNENVHGDLPEPTANVDSRTNYLIASVAIEGDHDTSYLTHALFYSFGQTSAHLIEAAVYEPRVNCNYEWVSQPVSCEETANEDFSILHVGVDDTGNTFQRVSTGICDKHVVLCMNGGQSFEGKCVCSEYWTGPTCRIPICQNGGQLSSDEHSCICPNGFGGKACELVMCTSKSDHVFSNDNKTLAFVVEKSTANKDAISKLAANLESIVGNVAQTYPHWLINFELVSFTTKGVDDQTQIFSDVKDAADALKKMADEATDPGACQMPIYEALGHLLKNDVLDGSEVFVVTQAVPSDEALAFEAYTLFGIHNPKVSVLHAPADDKHCAGTIDTDIYEHIARFALSTGGTFFRSSPTTLDHDLLVLLPTMRSSSVLDILPDISCNHVIYAQVDTGATLVFISVAGDTSTLTVDVQGADLTDQKPHTMVNTTAKQALFGYIPSAPGTHKITIATKGTGKCVTSITSVGGVQVFVGFTQNSANIDNAKPYAIAGALNYPVYHYVDANKTRSAVGGLYYTQAWVTSGGKSPGSQPDYASELERRGNCTYEYVSRPFGCDLDDVIYAAVSGSDSNVQTFSRMVYTFCLTNDGNWTTPLPPVTQPPRTPPTGSTLKPPGPEDIAFDIYFLVDVSENDDNLFYETIAKPFMHRLMSIYTISPSHAHVGIITLPGEAGMTMVSTFLGGVSGLDAFDRAIEQGEELADPGNQEYIVKALTRANDQKTCRKSSNGYRNDIHNHLIVILTESTDFESMENAAQAALAIRKENSYGLITIGYGSKVEPTKLEELSTHSCSYTAKDQETLNDDIVQRVQAQIWRAFEHPENAYCPEK